MNKKRSFENILINIKAEWLQDFIDGQGSFQFGIINTVNRGKDFLAINPSLEIAQISHDVKLLWPIKEFIVVTYNLNMIYILWNLQTNLLQ